MMGVIIGAARRPEPNARAKKLTAMFFTLVGTWRGTYTYFDEREDDYVGGPGTLVFKTTSMPNVLTLDALSERPGGSPVHAFTAMVVQADGASWRQMAFLEASGRIQDKLITDYSFDDDHNWHIDSVEVQQDLGGVSAAVVRMEVKQGSLTMTKQRKFEGGTAAARPYDSLARFDKVD